MGFTLSQAKTLLDIEVKLQLERAGVGGRGDALFIPLLLGPTGLGKTHLIHALAHEHYLPCLRINCGENSEPTDVAGMPVPFMMKKEGGHPYMNYVVNETIHRACCEPVVLFFDDIDKMGPAVEGGLLGIFGERQARSRILHPGTILIGAGNRAGDDILANQLSESLRTRATIIEVIPSVKDFCDYGLRTGEILPEFMGYVQYKQSQLHCHNADALRYPTPRGWAEASVMCRTVAPGDFLFEGKTHPAWRVFVDLKCGEGAGKDFWAWYTVVSRVDVERVLTTGELAPPNVKSDELNGGNLSVMTQYAASFAIAQRLNNKVEARYTGLEKYLEATMPELRVALLTQLSKQARTALGHMHAGAANLLMQNLLPVAKAAI